MVSHIDKGSPRYVSVGSLKIHFVKAIGVLKCSGFSLYTCRHRHVYTRKQFNVLQLLTDESLIEVCPDGGQA